MPVYQYPQDLDIASISITYNNKPVLSSVVNKSIYPFSEVRHRAGLREQYAGVTGLEWIAHKPNSNSVITKNKFSLTFEVPDTWSLSSEKKYLIKVYADTEHCENLVYRAQENSSSLSVDGLSKHLDRDFEQHKNKIARRYQEIAQHFRNANPHMPENNIVCIVNEPYVYDIEFDSDYESNHDNSVKLSFSLKIISALVMPFFKGETIAKIFKIGTLPSTGIEKSVSLYTCLQVAQSILSTLFTMHNNNTIHGDITPENILFDRDDNIIRIIDTDFAQHKLALALSTTPGHSAFWSYLRVYQPNGEKVQAAEYEDLYGFVRVLQKMLISGVRVGAEHEELVYDKLLQWLTVLISPTHYQQVSHYQLMFALTTNLYLLEKVKENFKSIKNDFNALFLVSQSQASSGELDLKFYHRASAALLFSPATRLSMVTPVLTITPQVNRSTV